MPTLVLARTYETDKVGSGNEIINPTIFSDNRCKIRTLRLTELTPKSFVKHRLELCSDGHGLQHPHIAAARVSNRHPSYATPYCTKHKANPLPKPMAILTAGKVHP